MTSLSPYLLLPGTARSALEFYAAVFGGELILSTYEEFGRDDGAPDSIAHGMLRGPVTIFAADAAAGEPTASMSGMHFALLGTAAGPTMHEWFTALAAGASRVDDLQLRPWGDYDGTLIDRFGVPWLLGYQPTGAESAAHEH